MGDGPAYDYMYEQMKSAAASKRKRQKKRVEALYKIMMDVGLGDNDGNLTRLEKEAADDLRRAYDILSLVAAQK